MPNVPFDPEVADTAPDAPAITHYDFEHLVTYLRILDANAQAADWRKVSRIVLHIDSEAEPERAEKAHDSHLARATWMMKNHRLLLRGDAVD